MAYEVVETCEEALEGIMEAVRRFDAETRGKLGDDDWARVYRLLGAIDAHYEMATGKDA